MQFSGTCGMVEPRRLLEVFDELEWSELELCVASGRFELLAFEFRRAELGCGLLLSLPDCNQVLASLDKMLR